MKTKISIRLENFPPADHECASGRPVHPAQRRVVAGTATGGRTSARQARVLVVAEADFDGRSIRDLLRRDYSHVKLASTREAIPDRMRSERIDVLLLCGQRSSRRVMDLLNSITGERPALPVIVVTSPPMANERGVSPASGPLSAPPVDAALLLRSLRDALTEPKVKRLIRLTGSRGEPKFIARNARWLCDDLQGRYSLPFHWTPAEAVIPLRIEPAAAAHPQPV
jgi:CheY-like chemotaxis protein